MYFSMFCIKVSGEDYKCPGGERGGGNYTLYPPPCTQFLVFWINCLLSMAVKNTFQSTKYFSIVVNPWNFDRILDLDPVSEIITDPNSIFRKSSDSQQIFSSWGSDPDPVTLNLDQEHCFNLSYFLRSSGMFVLVFMRMECSIQYVSNILRRPDWVD